MGEIATYTRGITYTKSDEISDVACGHQVLRSNNIDVSRNRVVYNDVRLVAAGVRIRDDQRLRAGDILVSASSGSKNHVGKVAYIDVDSGYTFGGFMAVIRTRKELSSKYLFYVLSSTLFAKYLEGAIANTTINNLSSDISARFPVPVPSLEKQEIIVEVLDRLDALVNDLSVGLPAELAARRKQYEYYRDRLLTFKEAVA